LGQHSQWKIFFTYIINIAALGKDRRLRPVYAIVPSIPLPAQTYSMVGLIISAMRLSRTWEEAFWRG
jgi:hypothetical protein